MQAWYADDSSAAGKLIERRKWWDILCQAGPDYGYFPLARKTVLIVKAEYFQMAEEIFRGSGVKITKEGERHMGAVVGSEEFKESYVKEKIEKWIVDVEELARIAKDEPQAVYSSFTKAISHRWTYVQRTVPDIQHLFIPLEEAIREKLIPAIIGRKVSNIERRIFALPVRLGGLGIRDPTKSSQEFTASSKITRILTQIIVNQERDFSSYDADAVKKCIAEVKAQKDQRLNEELNEIKESRELGENMERILDLSGEKGSGLWLTGLPIQSLGQAFNKEDFQGALCVRYDKNIPGTPSVCSCGTKNDTDHILMCKLGGYVSLRHNRIRDLEAELMREVCHDVKIEPDLIPIENELNTSGSGNKKERARLDVSGVGVWGPYEKTFLDIRVMHPNSPSYMNKSVEQVYTDHENQKKNKYLERVLQIEKGSFTPIVLSTYGGFAPEAEKHHRRIATLIANKRNENYADVINHIRTRLSFSLMKSIMTAARGVRGKKRSEAPISSVEFSLVERAGE